MKTRTLNWLRTLAQTQFHLFIRTHIIFASLIAWSLASAEEGASFIVPPQQHGRTSTEIKIFICLDEIIEYLNNPEAKSFPIPDPNPLSLGCELPGCDDILPGPMDLNVSLAGDLVESATLELQGPITAVNSLKADGPAVSLPSQPHRFQIKHGNSTVSGITTNTQPFPRTPEQRIKALLANDSSSRFLTANLHLSLQQTALRELTVKDLATSPQQEVANSVLNVQLRKGSIVIQEFHIRYTIELCQHRKGPDQDPPDRIHLLDAQGDDFRNEAVVLTNGLVRSGSGGSGSGQPSWVGPTAFKSTIFFNMPDNRLKTGPPCEQEGLTGKETCTFEISAFAKDKAMALATPPPNIPWTDNLGDEVPVKLDHDVLVVPVRFYILWQSNPAAPTGSSCESISPPTTECMAEQWRVTANTALFRDQAAGITFNHKDSNPTNQIIINTSDSALFDAGCSKLEAVYDHFRVDPAVPPDAVRVFFVRHSTDYSPTGNFIRAGAWTCQIGPSYPPFYSNDIFISTSVANSTTLAHELGHSLSLEDINDVYGNGAIFPHAKGLANNNLMYSGSPTRNSISQGQSFRANVNEWSAVHQHKSPGRSSSAAPRQCQDQLSNITCPALNVEK